MPITYTIHKDVTEDGKDREFTVSEARTQEFLQVLNSLAGFEIERDHLPLHIPKAGVTVTELP